MIYQVIISTTVFFFASRSKTRSMTFVLAYKKTERETLLLLSFHCSEEIKETTELMFFSEIDCNVSHVDFTPTKLKEVIQQANTFYFSAKKR